MVSKHPRLGDRVHFHAMCAMLPIRLRHLSRQILATSQVCHHSHHKTCLSFQFGNLRHVSRIVGGDMSFICQHYNQRVIWKDPIWTSVKPLVLQTCFFSKGVARSSKQVPSIHHHLGAGSLRISHYPWCDSWSFGCRCLPGAWNSQTVRQVCINIQPHKTRFKHTYHVL